ncbi:MAG: tRNA preQ1(34) S-adenosylmethionine ribosyltransferase-isomerase QueA [Candidatus Hydrogenedentota bacterium]
MKTSELVYTLPQELIAQRPREERDQARLLIVDRQTGQFHDDVFHNLPAYLQPGDCAVLNDTRVIRARLHGRKPTGGKVEVFLLREIAPGEWDALVRPSARVMPGTEITLPADLTCRVDERLPSGRRRVRFGRADVLEALEKAGEIPLPPYIDRDQPDASDLRRYQTVYAERPGAVAAPTAGLHFTERVFEALAAKGVQRARITLHVGYGTFRPIQSEDLAEHAVEGEDFEFPEETAARLNAIREQGGRILAVGTTTTRVLETCCPEGRFRAGSGVTGHYIYPPYTFRGVDLLLTNFHLPRSSLLALVCAFGGKDLILQAYRHAVEQQYRFYSYGDAMLIV